MAKIKVSKKYLLISLITIFFLSPPAALLRSMAVMSVYSRLQKEGSVPDRHGFDIKIPGGLSTEGSDWYPFVMTFNDDMGFQRFTGDKSLSLTIMYNFPSFSPLRGCSRLYDPASSYCSAFYGAYAVSDSDGGRYGFRQDGSLDTDSVSQVPQFDMQRLVLSAFGLSNKDMVFDWELTELEYTEYIGCDGWAVADANLIVNSSAHKSSGFVQPYLQYGVPRYSCESDFEPIKMYGRVYARYFEEYDSSIFFYILAPDKDVLDECDKNILSKSSVVSNNA